jgi:spermidine synthase
MLRWQTIERVETPEGRLELRRRGDRDFLITIAGRVLMTSAAHRSEDELARLACAPLRGRARPRLLLGGLGMAYTLRAALDHLPRAAEVTVVDLNPRVVAWCQGPLAPLTDGAANDPRVTIQIADVARVIARTPARSPARPYDAIVLDLYDGPRPGVADPLYSAAALARARLALGPGGALAIWSEEADPGFEARFASTGFEVTRHRVGGRGGRAHLVYLGVRREGGYLQQ